MSIDLTSSTLSRSLSMSSGINWISECVGEVKAKAEIDVAFMSLLDCEVVKLEGGTASNAPLIRALVAALIERRNDRSTIALMSEAPTQLRGRAREAAAGPA